MRIRTDNKYKMALRNYYDYFKNLVMFFGLTNTLAIFQDYINKILIETVDIVYLTYVY